MDVKIFVAKKFNNFAFQCQLKMQDSTQLVSEQLSQLNREKAKYNKTIELVFMD